MNRDTSKVETANDSASSNWLSRLAKEVVNYESTHFALKGDLEELAKVSDVEAVQCTTFCCSRIMEALTAEALGDLATSNVFANLESLQRFNLVRGANRYWLHALRRMGNDVRHVRCRIDRREAELALMFVERCLEWFFCALPTGYHLPSLTTDGQSVGLCGNAPLRSAVEALEAQDFDPVVLANEMLGADERVIEHCAPLAAVVVGELIRREKFETADRVLTQAETRFPEDLRILQLRGLFWRRRAEIGDLQRAIAHMEPVFRQFRNDDETIGIMAAMYKELWQQDESNTDSLRKAHRVYLSGWESGKKSNGYLGVNAATTALWLGRKEDSQALASEVRDALLRTAKTLRGFSSQASGTQFELDHWDQFTLGEAYLLLGQRDQAREIYVAAFTKHQEKVGDIQSALKQAAKILESQGLSDDTRQWWRT